MDGWLRELTLALNLSPSHMYDYNVALWYIHLPIFAFFDLLGQLKTYTC